MASRFMQFDADGYTWNAVRLYGQKWIVWTWPFFSSSDRISEALEYRKDFETSLCAERCLCGASPCGCGIGM